MADSPKISAQDHLREAWQAQEAGQLDRALSSIDAALEIAPNRSIYWVTKGRFLLEAGEHKAATKAAERAIEMSPRNYHAWILLGNVQRRLSLWRAAADSLARAASMKPHAVVFTLLASAQLHFDPKAAADSARRALEHDPSWNEASAILERATSAMKKSTGDAENRT